MNFLRINEAYNSLGIWLTSFGNTYESHSARSKERSGELHEIIGASWSLELQPAFEIFELIRTIDPKGARHRISELQRLGKVFVGEELDLGHAYYTYRRRMLSLNQIDHVVLNLLENAGKPDRQSFVSIWHPKDARHLGQDEVPCSIGYHFFLRDGVLSMVYFMRSLDLFVWPNDVYLSGRVLDMVAERIAPVEVGRTTFHVGSLHVFGENKR